MQLSQDSGRAPGFLTRRPVQSREQQILLSRQVGEWQGWPEGPDQAPPGVRRRGLRAQRALVEGNMGLVLKMARGFMGRGVDYDDLVQAGAIGLMTAARKFDPTRGHAFSTYAVWWIRQALQRESRRGTTIALPLHTSELAYRALATASRLETEGRKTATLEEVSIELQNRWSAQQLGTAIAALHRTRVRSLNSRPRDVEDGSELMDLVGDSLTADEQWERLIQEDEHERLQGLVAELDERSQAALLQVDRDGATLGSVAKAEGVSRETVRQWVMRARHQVQERWESGAIPSPQRQQADAVDSSRRPGRRRARHAATA